MRGSAGERKEGEVRFFRNDRVFRSRFLRQLRHQIRQNQIDNRPQPGKLTAIWNGRIFVSPPNDMANRFVHALFLDKFPHAPWIGVNYSVGLLLWRCGGSDEINNAKQIGINYVNLLHS